MRREEFLTILGEAVKRYEILLGRTRIQQSLRREENASKLFNNLPPKGIFWPFDRGGEIILVKMNCVGVVELWGFSNSYFRRKAGCCLY